MRHMGGCESHQRRPDLLQTNHNRKPSSESYVCRWWSPEQQSSRTGESRGPEDLAQSKAFLYNQHWDRSSESNSSRLFLQKVWSFERPKNAQMDAWPYHCD